MANVTCEGIDLFECDEEIFVEVTPCGSRFLCDPPTLDTDIDFLVLSDVDLTQTLKPQGYATQEFAGEGSSLPSEGPSADRRFKSYRRGNVNLIVTQSSAFAERHRAAGSLVRRFNVLDKRDRVAIYKAVLYAEVS